MSVIVCTCGHGAHLHSNNGVLCFGTETMGCDCKGLEFVNSEGKKL